MVVSLTELIRDSEPVPVTHGGAKMPFPACWKVPGVRRFIHVCGDFIDARQRMQHLHVVARAFEVAGAQHELRLHVGVSDGSRRSFCTRVREYPRCPSPFDAGT